jgi:hypothetical protein
MSAAKIALTSVAAIVLALATSAWLGTRRQHHAAAGAILHLRSSARDAAATLPSATARLEPLPAPVARYLRWALRTDAPIREVRLTQTGTLRTSLESTDWLPFTAEHIVVPPATGFVWNARVTVMPLVHVRVVDALVEGRGSGRVSLMSALTVGEDSGTPEMNSGSLHRYLAEAVWYPAALLPSDQLRWSAIDDARALATLTSHGTTVSLEFRFGESGEVTGIYTPARWGKFDDGYRQVAWEGHFRDYRPQHDIMVPTEGDVGWYVNGIWQAVWQGAVTSYEVD